MARAGNVGGTIATVIHMVIAMAGLAAILHTSAVLFQVIKWLQRGVSACLQVKVL